MEKELIEINWWLPSVKDEHVDGDSDEMHWAIAFAITILL